MSAAFDSELEWLAEHDVAPSPRKRGRRLFWLLVAGWLCAVCAGMALLTAHSLAPGRAAAAPRAWPDQSSLRPARDTPTLVMVVHPRCSCSRASIGELSWLMTRLAGRVQAHVLFVRPEGTGTDWVQTDLWRSAARISGVEVSEDRDGLEARRFGAATSGQVYLYGRDGRLRFAGGITPGRSHFGASVGRQTIVSLVASDATDRDRSEVYGCPLSESEAPGFRLSSLRWPSTDP